MDKDRVCFENKNNEKGQLIGLFNSMILDEYVSFRVSEEVSQKIIKDWPCSKIRDYLRERLNKYNEKIGPLVSKGKIKPTKDKPPIQILLEKISLKMTEAMKCLNPQAQQELLCSTVGKLVGSVGVGYAGKKILEMAEFGFSQAQITNLEFQISGDIKELKGLLSASESKRASSSTGAAPNAQTVPAPDASPVKTASVSSTTSPPVIPISQKAFTAPRSAVGYQGDAKTKELMNALQANGDKLPIDQFIAKRRYYSDMYDGEKLQSPYSKKITYVLDSSDLARLHRTLMETNPKYKLEFEKLSGHESSIAYKKTLIAEDKKDRLRWAFDTYVEDAFRKSGLNVADFAPKVVSTAETRAFENLYFSSDEFRIWYLSQSKLPNFEVDFSGHAKQVIDRWNSEVGRRLQESRPQEAFVGISYVTPELEKAGRIAYFGQEKYVSTPDGKYWISATPNQTQSVIPRWMGKNKDQFIEESKLSENSSFQQKILDQYPAMRGLPVGVEIPLSNPAKIPGSSQGIVYNKGEPQSMTSNVYAVPLVEKFIMNRSWGYHLTPFDRLRKILDNGWNPGETSGVDGARVGTPTLHMSTHLGIDFSLGPTPTAILRTPLSPGTTKMALPEGQFGDQLFFGHVIRETGIPAERVPAQLEFSVDGGISWYPMKKDFVELAEKGRLPNYRSQIIPQSH